MAELYRYAAFISYSSKDAAFAKRLHRALESYGIPNQLGSFDLTGSGKKNRIYPVFRDREELSAGDLGERIEAALSASAALIVVCSPNAAASPWVQKEIEHFISLGRAHRIFAIIADTAPLFDDDGHEATAANFPPAFKGDALSAPSTSEPLAADARKGKDGFRNAWLKIVGGLIGVTPGQIINRDARARNRRMLQSAFVWGMVAALVGVGFAFREPIQDRLVSELAYKRFTHSAAELTAAAPRTVFQDCAPGSQDCPRMVILPAGSFAMPDGYGAVRKISVARFAVSETELTFDDWAVCARNFGCTSQPDPLDNANWGRGRRPVINVSWNDAQEYVKWLSHMTGAKYRLLSEAEWEYAARGLTSADIAPEIWGFGDNVAELGDYAWFRDNSGEGFQTHPVRTKKANRFGLYDIHGNVWEWVQDCLDNYDRSLQDARAVGAPESTCQRVLRGGSSGWAASGQETSSRRDDARTDRRDNIGIRIAREIGPPLILPKLSQAMQVPPTSGGIAALPPPPPPPTNQEVDAALMANDEQRLAEFLRRGWKPSTTLNSEGTTPLHRLMESCENHHDRDPQVLVRIARMLIEAGARKDAPNRWNETPEFLAAVPRYCGPDHPVVAYLQTVP